MLTVIGAGLCPVLLGVLVVAWPRPPVYSVAAVTAGLRRQPARWIGRTVAVRGLLAEGGIIVPFGAGVPAQGALLLDNWPFTPTAAAPYLVDASGRYRLDVPRTQPALLIRGPAPSPLQPRPDPLRTLTQAIAEWAARPDVLGPDESRQVYRVVLLPPGRCPPPIASPCLSGVLR